MVGCKNNVNIRIKAIINIIFKYGNLKNFCRVSTLRGVHVSSNFLVKYLIINLYVDRTAKCIVKKFSVREF
jgi:hypothetical protein